MNPVILVLSLGASFIGGTVFGGYLASRKLTKEFEEWRKVLEDDNKELHEERDRAKKRLKETIDRYSDETDARLRETIEETEPENDISKPDVTKKSQSRHNSGEKPNLKDLVEQYRVQVEHPEDDEEEVDDPFEDISDEEDEEIEEHNIFYDGGNDYKPRGDEDDPYRPPFEISTEELEGEFSDSELTSITYFQGDQMLLDERNELITDVAGLLGALVADALPTCEDDCIYVHNDAHDTNYEVVIDQGSSGYLDSVMRKYRY